MILTLTRSNRRAALALAAHASQQPALAVTGSPLCQGAHLRDLRLVLLLHTASAADHSVHRTIRSKDGTRSNRRQEAKEEVVQGKGCVKLSSRPRQRPRRHQLRPSKNALANSPRCTVKDKANHAVIFDKNTTEKLNKDVQSYRLITVAVLVDRLKINGSLARKALKDLEERGVIKQVVGHSACKIYSE